MLLPESAKSGNASLLWREGYAAVVRAEENGWSGWGPLWATARVPADCLYAVPGDLQTLRFHFPVGNTVYAALIAKPGLRAIVTVDWGISRFRNARFLIRP